MKELLLKISNYGIKSDATPEIIEQTKLVNLISLLGVPVCVTYAPLFLITGYNYHALVCVCGIVIFTIPLLLNKIFGVNTGRVFITVMASFYFGFLNIFTGKDAGFYLGFLVVSVPPIIVFPQLKKGLAITGLSLLLMVLSILGNVFIKPFCEIPFSMAIYLFNLFTVFVCTVTVVYIFKKELSESREILTEKNKEILDSINYAKKIQYTLLAHSDLLNKHLPEHFVLFKPKDIVSGDFYWATSVVTSSMFQVSNSENNNTKQETLNKELFFLAICDSTGHGVPGAFMSLLNISFLNEAITEKGILQPHLILNHTRQRLIQNVSQEGAQDGMDGILIRIEKHNDTLKIEYAAANNAPVLVSNNILTELAYDKMPIGKGEKNTSFTLHNIELKKGDALYLYTDGYADQFGGPKGKKFKYKQLEDLLLANSKLSLQEQSEILNKTIETWKGSLIQVDDICVFGIRA
jgi:serine phosphatase RsbU (regulator of sigma subunit)